LAPEIDQIRRLLAGLDGSDRYSLVLWRLPAGRQLDEADPDSKAREYIQAAGSADRMTVEVRRLTSHGPEQFVVGRTAPSSPSDPLIELRWSGYTTQVYPSEVFDATEATDLFDSYRATDWIPSKYSLRRLDVGSS